jgi:hypothetical protein
MHRELFPPEHERTARRRPTGIRLYGRSWQRQGVTPDHWPVPRRRTRMSWRGSWLAKYLAAARSPAHRRENLKVVSFAANLRVIMAIWAAGVGALPRPPLAGSAGKSFTIILAIFPEFLPLASSRSTGRLTDGTASRRGPAGTGSEERRLGPCRGMIDSAQIRGRPPRSDLMCHAGRRGHQLPDISSSTALKCRSSIFEPPEAIGPEDQSRWPCTHSNSSFRQNASPARTLQWEAME